MAYIEVNNIVGSSLDNFLIFKNSTSSRPMVTFRVTGFTGGEIHIKDALDEDGFNRKIHFSPVDIISETSFRSSSDYTATLFSLMECLKKNPIFYDIDIITDIPNVGAVLRCYIDTSTRYSITATSGTFIIGGDFASYVPKEPNKFVVLENTSNGGQITLEKYTYNTEVSFNVTAPFEHLTFKDPINVKLVGYRIDNNEVIGEPIAVNNIVVLPTTLTKFSDIDLTTYKHTGGNNKVNFLTNNFNRSYNYGEVAALSVLSTSNSVSIKKLYYTLSGIYLGSDGDVLMYEVNNGRHDFYFTLDLETIEASTNKQVGYVLVTATSGGNDITNAIKYIVEPKCNVNNEVYFVNELGGIDEFNFLGEKVYQSKIDKQTTYFKNPVRKWGSIKELEIVSQKYNKVEHTFTTTLIDASTAKWLNELSKSKYHFFLEGGKIVKIIVNDVDITISDRENIFEVSLTYQYSDDNVSL